MRRREFITIAGGAVTYWPFRVQAVDDQSRPAANTSRKSRLILLGTAGGPTPKPNRSARA